jgi:gluconate 2-dehydrogenase gamma chain
MKDSGFKAWRSALPKSSRRRFLVTGAALAAAGCGERRGPWRALAEDEVRTLDAVCDQLIPADQDPGAHATGVIVYIDRQLAGPYRRHLEAYRAGLAKTDEIARSAHGKRFFELAPEQRLAICRRLEQEQKPFFDLVLAHAMQGYYGNPRHGGNREYASWRMLGLTVSPVRGRNLYDLRKGGA